MQKNFLKKTLDKIDIIIIIVQIKIININQIDIKIRHYIIKDIQIIHTIIGKISKIGTMIIPINI